MNLVTGIAYTFQSVRDLVVAGKFHYEAFDNIDLLELLTWVGGTRPITILIKEHANSIFIVLDVESPTIT